MFFSQDILYKKGGRLGLVWIAANFNTNGSGLNLSRREYCSVDIEEACDEVVRLEKQFALRLTANLMVGIVRIHSKQTHYIYVESKNMWQRMKTLLQTSNLSAIDLPPQKSRSDGEPLPDPLKNISPNSSVLFPSDILDLSLSGLPIGSDSDFITDADMMLLPPIPDTPETRPGSVGGSPFTADPQDITICEDEGTPLENLQIQVPGEKDFGDGEIEEVITGPVTLLDGVPMPVLNLSYKEEEGGGNADYSIGDEDGVLLFDDETESFRVYNGGAQPTTPSSKSPSNGGAHPTKPTSETPKKEKEESSVDNGFFTPFSRHRGDNATPRRRYHRSYLDKETKMNSNTIRENLNNAESTLKSRKKLPQKLKATRLLSQPTCSIMTESEIFLALWKRCTSEESSTHEEFDLEDIDTHRASTRAGQHTIIRPVSTLTSPDPMEVGRGQNVSDLELMRGGSRNGELSYDDGGLLAASNTYLMSDVSAANSTRNGSLASFNTSSAQRKSGNLGKLFPPTMGGLSPIVDEEGEMDTTTGGTVGFPLLDVSYGSPTLTAGSTTPPTIPSSPFVESEPSLYCRHIAGVMSGQTDIEFQELLPQRSTRKTASRAFSHILTLVSRGSLEVQQTESYGPIVLKMKSSL